MGLSAGTQLGNYVILSPLGAGGMGEVYRARDMRLGREVAIKVLPAEVAGDSDRLRRFEQEARAASALNHPNIVTIYELGESGATRFIAMELVAGETLRSLLASERISWKKAIAIARQVAQGMAKAHEAGIIHRDLKPENLMISQDGLVKILDFGLAKLASDPIQGLSEASTTVEPQTGRGTILGTVHYMSPEQVSGEPLDFRSDQFAFGAILYEMLTGKRAFQRKSAGETLAAILKEEPEAVNALTVEAPAPLCWVVERCLAKESEQRYFSTRDLERDLEAMDERVLKPPPKTPRAVTTNLPVQRTRFVGRDAELAAVKDLLLRADVRLVTLTGPGGIGKTRLGLEAAGGLAEQFPGGVYFVSLAPVNDPGLIASVIGQALGVREMKGQTPEEAVGGFLEGVSPAPVLMVLDNFEHLIPAAARVAEMLTLAPHLKVLVTSRAPLRVYGEHEFSVPPFVLPEARATLPIETISKQPAVSLFVQRALAVKPDFDPGEETTRIVAEICARLDGLPLAIELAAARVKLLSPAAMLTRLESRLPLLTGGARDLPARHQTLRAAMDWSYQLLNGDEQKLFRRLSVFAGGCTLEAAEAVCNASQDLSLDILEGVASIVDKSLLRRVEQSDAEPRFTMLGTIREYGAEQLAARGEQDLAKRAHAAYCLVLAEEGGLDETSTERTDRLRHLDAEQDNFRAALEWLIDTGNAEWGLRLGAGLFRYWEIREQLTEGREWLARLLKMKGAAGRTKERARVLFCAGVLAGEQGDFDAARRLMEESLEISRASGDNWAIVVAVNALAVNARDRGDLSTARALFEEGLALWRELRDHAAIARALSNLASVKKLQGEYAAARALYGEARAIFLEIGDRPGAAWSLNHEGDAAREQGDAAAARSCYEKSMAAFRELEDRWGMASSMADLGNLARDEGDFTAAHSFYCESIRVFQGLDHKRGIARLLECFAVSAAAQSQAARALRLAGAAAALRQLLGVPPLRSEQASLEKQLESARRLLADSAGAQAWIEGWELPAEKAIEEARKTNIAQRA